MGKYSSYNMQKEDPLKKQPIHPIWRGIGFGMIVLIPFLSYIGALAVLQENARNRWFTIPRDLLVQWSDPLILVKVLLTIAIAFILYILFTLIAFILMKMFAPSRYGPYDVPPVAYRGKKRVR